MMQGFMECFGYYLLPAFLWNALGTDELKVSKFLEQNVSQGSITTPSNDLKEGVNFAISEDPKKLTYYVDTQGRFLQSGYIHKLLYANGAKCGFARYKIIRSSSMGLPGNYAIIDRIAIADWHLKSQEETNAAYECLYQSIRKNLKYPRSVEMIIPLTDLMTQRWCNQRGFRTLKKYDGKAVKGYLMSFRNHSERDESDSD
jgi:hypothetical protein